MNATKLFSVFLLLPLLLLFSLVAGSALPETPPLVFNNLAELAAGCKELVFQPQPQPQPQESNLAKAAHWAQIWTAILGTLAALLKSCVWLAEKGFCKKVKRFWDKGIYKKVKRFWDTVKNFAMPNPFSYLNNFLAGSFNNDFFGRWFRATKTSRGGGRAPPQPHGRQATGDHIIDVHGHEEIELDERGRGHEDSRPVGHTHHLSPIPGTARMRGNRRVGGDHSRSTSR